MKESILVGFVCSTLLLAACGAPGGEAGEATTTGSPETTETDHISAGPPSTTTTPERSSEFGELVASMRAASSELTSARIEATIEMTGMDADATGLSELAILFRTAFDSATGDSSFLLDMSSLADSPELQELEDSEDPFAAMAGSFLGEMEFRQIGDRVYVKFPFFTAMFGAETDWVSMPAEHGDEFAGTLEAVPSDPSEIIEVYESAAATVEDVGMETVNGVEATHYRISLDTDEMGMTDEERAELESSGLFAEGTIPMDIWVTGDGHPVRLILEIDGTGLDVPPEERFDSMRMQYDVFDINQEIVIEPPPESEVTAIEDLEGSLFESEPEE